ncbi:AAA family ATPase [Paludibacterium yongneupense]|uniref:AAA family ATPase n=1 Tax=Paludibacterium yongneupense TaxID=400061 RepID=UPI000400A6DE|nr:ATP-binding protein [Paludibacterium yongneupense]
MSQTVLSPPRVAVLGPESCGKTTLVEALAARCLQHGVAAVAVPEYAREYYRERAYRPEYADVVAIARGQLAAEDGACIGAEVLICDTTVSTCKIWSDVAFGRCGADLLALHRPDSYALTLLTSPDIPWQPDPLRSHPHERESLWQRYCDELARARVVPVHVRGTHEERVATAWRAMRQCLPGLPII